VRLDAGGGDQAVGLVRGHPASGERRRHPPARIPSDGSSGAQRKPRTSRRAAVLAVAVTASLAITPRPPWAENPRCTICPIRHRGEGCGEVPSSARQNGSVPTTGAAWMTAGEAWTTARAASPSAPTTLASRPPRASQLVARRRAHLHMIGFR
jgi:hypothetical protein